MKKLFAGAAVLVLMLGGCSNSEEEYLPKSSAVEMGEATAVSIDVRDRYIEVAASEDELIHLDYYESASEYYNLVNADGVFKMTAANNKDRSDYIGGKASEEYRKITLRLPEGALNMLELNTTNEDICITETVSAEEITLSDNGGDIVFAALDAGSSIELENKNGDITGNIVGGWDDYAITSEIKKGSCNLPEEKSGGEKTLSVHNNNGDINIEFVPIQ